MRMNGLFIFIVGFIIGFIVAIAFVGFYFVETFGWDFVKLLIGISDGNISPEDAMNFARYFGYI
jgi:hypothetical protein